MKDPELVRGKELAYLELILCARCFTDRTFIGVARLSGVQLRNSFSVVLKTALQTSSVGFLISDR